MINEQEAFSAFLVKCTQAGFRKHGKDLDHEEVLEKFIGKCYDLAKSSGQSIEGLKNSLNIFMLMGNPYKVIREEYERLCSEKA